MPGRLTTAARRSARLPLEWSCVKRTRPDAEACGDAAAVKAFSGGLLLAAIDGLGRGQEAALAAESAVQVLTRYGRQPLPGLVMRCHRTLLMTRGVALLTNEGQVGSPLSGCKSPGKMVAGKRFRARFPWRHGDTHQRSTAYAEN